MHDLRSVSEIAKIVLDVDFPLTLPYDMYFGWHRCMLLPNKIEMQAGSVPDQKDLNWMIGSKTFKNFRDEITIVLYRACSSVLVDLTSINDFICVCRKFMSEV
jgi:hypothetical protein